MTETRRKVGRPKLDEEQAWASAMTRVDRFVRTTLRKEDGTECLVYKGPRQLEIADGQRTTVKPREIVARALGIDITLKTHKIVLSCGRRNCVSPDHILQVDRYGD